MDEKRWQPPGVLQPMTIPGIGPALDAASRLTRRLIPFPGSESELLPSSLAPVLRGNPAQVGGESDAVAQAPARIVAEAASILDEEMARGVLSARNLAARPGVQERDGTAPMLRQVHELVDQLAAAWPTLQGAIGRGGAPAGWAQPASTEPPVCELRGRGPVQPGQRASVAMTVSNDESTPLVVTLLLTDLLSANGERIVASNVDVSPPELRLGAGGRQEVHVSVTVPGAAKAGSYTGLVVAKGVDDLRALITIDVR